MLRPFGSVALATLLFLIITRIQATSFDVNVGLNGLLQFQPNYLTNVQVGDTVVFHFFANHSLTRSDFDTPCTSDNGGDSGWNSQDALAIVYDTVAPQWYFCKQPEHCAAGMVFAINPPQSGSQTFENFQAAALATAPDIPPSQSSSSSSSSSQSTSDPTSDPPANTPANTAANTPSSTSTLQSSSTSSSSSSSSTTNTQSSSQSSASGTTSPTAADNNANQTTTITALGISITSNFSTITGTSTPIVESATQSSSAETAQTHSSPSKGAMVGGAIGGLAALAIICVGALFLVRRHRRNIALPEEVHYDSVPFSQPPSTLLSPPVSQASSVFPQSPVAQYSQGHSPLVSSGKGPSPYAATSINPSSVGLLGNNRISSTVSDSIFSSSDQPMSSSDISRIVPSVAPALGHGEGAAITRTMSGSYSLYASSYAGTAPPAYGDVVNA